MPTSTLSEQKINQIHEELTKEQENKKSQGFLERIPYDSRKWIGLGVAALLFYIYKNNIDIGKAILMLGGTFFIMMIFLQDGEKSRRLTEQECAVSLYKKLRWKQLYKLGKHNQLPRGEIIIEIEGKERWNEGKPWKREMGFYIINYNTKMRKYYSAEIDIWNGDITGIRDRPKRYTGAESPDLKYIASKEVLDEKRYHEFGGKFYTGGGRR